MLTMITSYFFLIEFTLDQYVNLCNLKRPPVGKLDDYQTIIKKLFHDHGNFILHSIRDMDRKEYDNCLNKYPHLTEIIRNLENAGWNWATHDWFNRIRYKVGM